MPYYYAAANAINWQLPIQRISERNNPLKPKTLRRIQMGLDRFAAAPVLIELAHGSATSGMVRSALSPYPTQTTAQSVGLVSPFLVGLDHMQATGNYAHSVASACTTQTARQDKALVVPYLIELYGTSTARAVTEPLSTVTAQGNHHGLVVAPQEAASSFLVSYYGQNNMRPISEAMGTLTTLDRHALVTPPAEDPRVEDCYFRMLHPSEIGRAMAFPETYIVLGNSRQKQSCMGTQ